MMRLIYFFIFFFLKIVVNLCICFRNLFVGAVSLYTIKCAYSINIKKVKRLLKTAFKYKGFNAQEVKLILYGYCDDDLKGILERYAECSKLGLEALEIPLVMD